MCRPPVIALFAARTHSPCEESGSPTRALLPGLLLPVMLFAAHSAMSADSVPEVFVPDTSFNAGFVIDDRFATTSFYTNFHGRKLVALPGGEQVAVGLVPAAWQVDQANGLYNIGLVRYGADGSRVPWPAPSAAYVSYLNRYLQYPNAYSQYENIVGATYFNGYIFIVADYVFSTSSRSTHLVVFRADGQFIGAYSASATPTEQGRAVVGFTSSGANRILVVAQGFAQAALPGGGTQPQRYLRLSRFVQATDGSLSLDNTFGTDGRVYLSQPGCGSTDACDLEAVAVSLVGTGNASQVPLFGPLTLYAVGSTSCLAQVGLCAGAFPLQLLVINPVSGAVTTRTIVQPRDTAAGQYLDSRAVDIVAVRGTLAGGGWNDRVFSLAQVEGECNGSPWHYRRGLAVLRSDATGALVTSFGSGGTLLAGGPSLAATAPCPASYDVVTPFAMRAGSYERLAIAASVADRLDAPTTSQGLLAVARMDRGAMADVRAYPALRPGGGSWGQQASFRDVRAVGTNAFRLTGELTTEYNAWQFGTLGLRSDRLFADDFD